MRKKKVRAIAIKSFALLVVLGTAYLGSANQAMAQDAATPYPNMAPIDQYLMTDQGAEIALARSAAPESISRDADVLVLGRHGFETAVKGKNGFVCIVERSWTSAPDPDFWNPKVRTPICYNAAAAHSYLPRNIKRTELDPGGTHESSDGRDHRGCRRQKRTAGDGIRGDVLHDVKARIRRRHHPPLAFPPHVSLIRTPTPQFGERICRVPPSLV